MADLLWSDDGCEIWHGDCLNQDDVLDVMGDRKADLLNVDAPYSEKTHAGHDGGVRQVNGYNADTKEGAYARRHGETHRKGIDYPFWTPENVHCFVANWMPHVSGWWCSTTDDKLAAAWSDAMQAAKLYTFAPLPWVEVGSRVRLVGDGPSNWTCWLVVGRPRRAPYSKWGTLRGAYILPAENHQNRPERITGGKSIPGTVQLIEDYSRPGDLVVDPCLGGGTTMIAARMCGRRCVGIERDLERAKLCVRLMRDGARSKADVRQERLFQ